MAVNISTLNIELKVLTAQFVKGLNDANSQVKAFSKKFQDFTGISLGAAGAIGAATLAVNHLKDSLADSLARVDEAGEFSRSMGLMTEELLAFQHAAKFGGSSAEGLNDVVAKLVSNLGLIRSGAGKSASEALQRIGLDAQAISQMSTGAAFTEITEAISKLKSPADQAAAAVAIFGKRGLEILPMLQEGKEGLRKNAEELERLGASFTDLDAKRVEEAVDAIDRLKIAVQGLSDQAAIALAPLIEDLAKMAQPLIKLLGLYAKFQGAVMSGELGKLGIELAAGKAKSTPPPLPGAGFEDTEETQKAAEKAAEKLQKEADEITKSLRTPFQAFRDETTKLQSLLEKGLIRPSTFDRGMEEAQKKLRESNESWKDAQEVLENTRTPLEKFQIEVMNLQAILKAGEITPEVYGRAVALANKELRDSNPAFKKMQEETEKIRGKMSEFWKETRTPIEQFQAKMAELFDLGKRGLDPVTLRRAADRAASEAAKSIIGPAFTSPGAVEAGSAAAISAMASAENRRAYSQQIALLKLQLKEASLARLAAQETRRLLGDRLPVPAKL